LLIWLYYSAQIFLFGAEFTKVQANRSGSGIVPADNAERVPGKDPSEPPGAQHVGAPLHGPGGDGRGRERQATGVAS